MTDQHYDKTIGARIADLRRAKGYSQEYVAEQLGVSRQAVSKWEQDQSAPDTYNLIALSRLLGVTVEYIAVGEVTPPPAPASEAVPPLQPTVRSQHIVGYILLGVGLLALIVGLFLSLLVAVLGVGLVLGGILCLTVRKNLGLVLAWTYWGIAVAFTALLMGGIMLCEFNATDSFTQESVLMEPDGTIAAHPDKVETYPDNIGMPEEEEFPEVEETSGLSLTWSGMIWLIYAVWLVINIILTVRYGLRGRRIRATA